MDDIMNLIVTREQARMNKEWSYADSVREQLLAMGVTIFDKSASWKTADGRQGRIPTFSEIENGVTAETLANGGTAPVAAADDDPTTAQIKYLVQQREQARATKDFDKGDKIREELKALGVELFDKEKLWRAKGGQSGVIIGYRTSGPPTDMEINTLIVQREKARQNSDFSTSDMIRDELKLRGVQIHDSQKVWKATDGRSGGVPSWDQIQGGVDMTGGMAGMAMLGMQGGGKGGQANAIQALTMQNNLLKAALSAQMTGKAIPAQALGMLTGQKVPVAAKAIAPTPVKTGPRPPEVVEALKFIQQRAAQKYISDEEILWLVSCREKVRQNKDYNSADALRDAMKNSLSIELFEREKQWRCKDGRTGAIPLWDSLS